MNGQTFHDRCGTNDFYMSAITCPICQLANTSITKCKHRQPGFGVKCTTRGKLNDVQRQFWEARSAEEFYDLEKDPEETVNLINDKDYQQEIKRFRGAHRQKTMEIRDPGFIPESMLHQIAHQPGNVAGFCADPQRYPLKKIFEMASQAAQTTDSVPPSLLSCADSENPILRYWLAMAFLVRGPDACRDHSKLLRQTDGGSRQECGHYSRRSDGCP